MTPHSVMAKVLVRAALDRVSRPAAGQLAPLQAAVAAFKPDVLVADLFGLAGFWIAEAQHDLPLVINMPANYAIYNMITTVIPKLYAVLRCLPCLRPRHMSWEAVRFMREEMRPRIAKALQPDVSRGAPSEACGPYKKCISNP